MNKRMRELAREAGFYANPDIEKFEKFAELIVEECADVLRVESERLYKLAEEEKDEVFASNFEICAEKCWDNEVAIKIHFGVKPFGDKE